MAPAPTRNLHSPWQALHGTPEMHILYASTA